MGKRTLGVILAGATLGVVTGCGSYNEANNYNQSDNVKNVSTLTWVRLDSPANYPTIMHACWNGLGIYIDQDASNSVRTQAQDPTCDGNMVKTAP